MVGMQTKRDAKTCDQLIIDQVILELDDYSNLEVLN